MGERPQRLDDADATYDVLVLGTGLVQSMVAA